VPTIAILSRRVCDPGGGDEVIAVPAIATALLAMNSRLVKFESFSMVISSLQFSVSVLGE
jgi:hypothetical protein